MKYEMNHEILSTEFKIRSCVEKRVLRAKHVQGGRFTLITGSISQA